MILESHHHTRYGIDANDILESTILTFIRSIQRVPQEFTILIVRLPLIISIPLALALLGPVSLAQSVTPLLPIAYSTSSAPEPASAADEPLPNLPLPHGIHASTRQAELAAGRSIRPFSTVGFAITGGTGGIGLELATPLAEHLNLRLNGSYFSYYTDFTTDGINVNGRILARSVNATIDYFPFHNGFRLSPGVTLDNANAVHGTLAIPAGQSFDLGDTTYVSSATDPVIGVASLSFGNRIAPSFTTGWGNLISRHYSHFSAPFEIGFEYIGAPLVAFNLQGTACDQNNNCGQLQTEPDSLANEQQQRVKINNDIRPLRFFPIISIGFGYSF